MKTTLLFSRVAAVTVGVAGTIGALVLLAGDRQAKILTATGAEVRPTEPWAALVLLLISLALGVVAVRRSAR